MAEEARLARDSAAARQRELEREVEALQTRLAGVRQVRSVSGNAERCSCGAWAAYPSCGMSAQPAYHHLSYSLLLPLTL